MEEGVKRNEAKSKATDCEVELQYGVMHYSSTYTATLGTQICYCDIRL